MAKRNAFTLLEVMVAVMIISVVIGALFQMQGTTTHKLINLKKMTDTNQYSTFLLENTQYGFGSSHIDMARLVEDFNVDDDLRRRLKEMSVELQYRLLNTIDTSEMSDEKSGGVPIIIEIGKTTLKTDKFKNRLIRMRLQ